MTLYEKTPVPIVFANEDEWRAARDTFVGGSEAAALMGLSPWADAWKIYGQKTGLVPPMEDTQKLRLGRRMEVVLADEYTHLTGRKVRRVENTIYRHKDVPYMAASPDCLCVDETRGVEFKNVGSFAMDGWGTEGTDEIPEYYLIQVQDYMEVLDVPVWDVAAMMAGQEVRIYTVERVPLLGKQIREMIERFWNSHIVPCTPPPIDASDTAKLWIEKKFPRASAPLRIAEPHEAKWLADLKDVREAQKRLEDREKELRNLITASLGESEGFTADIGSVTWKERQGRTTTDWEEIAIELGANEALIKRHTRVGAPTRTFLPNFKAKKGKA